MKIIILLLGFIVLTASEANTKDYEYYSLSSGQINLTISESDSMQLVELGTADISDVHICSSEEFSVCLNMYSSIIVAPRDLYKRFNSTTNCEAISWQYDKYSFKVSFYEDHGIHHCGQRVKQLYISILGQEVSAVKVNVFDNQNKLVSKFLLSEIRGLIGFSDFSGAEYWLSSNCGYGASSDCYNK